MNAEKALSDHTPTGPSLSFICLPQIWMETEVATKTPKGLAKSSTSAGVRTKLVTH